MHEYVHDPNTDFYRLEAAERFEVAQGRVFTSLDVSMVSGRLIVTAIPVSSMLSMKLVAKAVGEKLAEMVSKSCVERSIFTIFMLITIN